MTNPAVKRAYDNFQMICNLTKDHTVGNWSCYLS
jgi:hypothetical protein